MNLKLYFENLCVLPPNSNKNRFVKLILSIFQLSVRLFDHASSNGEHQKKYKNIQQKKGFMESVSLIEWRADAEAR